MMNYLDSAQTIIPGQVTDFLVDQPNPPDSGTYLRLLKQRWAVVLAFDEDAGRVVDCITAFLNQILSGYIPLLDACRNPIVIFDATKTSVDTRTELFFQLAETD